MDELLTQFNSSFDVNKAAKNSGSSFSNLFKNCGHLANQENRRAEILEIQKSNRQNNIDKSRGILEIVKTIEDANIYKEEEKVKYIPKVYVPGFSRKLPTYSGILTLSEWFIEKPQDLEENWLLVPCPEAIRVIVVANGVSTKLFNKYGGFKFECQTALPGGNSYIRKNRAQCCVLDGFYQKKNNTLYVLDLLAWNNQPMTDCETEFRNYWLTTQFSDHPELSKVTKMNEIAFTLLPKISCDTRSLNEYLSNYPPFENNFPLLDGMLFYHKKAHYLNGTTPLVGWMYPYMIPEVLGSELILHESYLDGRPTGYVNQMKFIEEFEEKCSKKKSSRKSNNVENTNENISNMDAEEANTSEDMDSETAKVENESENADLKTMVE